LRAKIVLRAKITVHLFGLCTFLAKNEQKGASKMTVSEKCIAADDVEQL